MNALVNFIKREIVFVISAAAAIVTMFFVKPSFEYIDYIDFPVIIVLFCLMAVVEGLKKNGAFDLLSEKLISPNTDSKLTFLLLVILCFFISMFVTNDVALIAFVPFTIYITHDKKSDTLIYTIVLETVAANLGSILTPIGNPQNLFLYHHYDMNIADFFRITFPPVLAGFCMIAAASAAIFLTGNSGLAEGNFAHVIKVNAKRNILFFCGLFLLCAFTVLKIIEYKLCLIIVIASIFVIDKSILKYIDYWLLMTFINFFIVVGNLTNMENVVSLVTGLLNENEFYAGLLVSQIISNVPAAILLSPFTDNVKNLILGVDIGGLGTLVASLASLISFKLYSLIDGANKLRYVFCFTAVNLLFVALLTVLFH